MSQIKISGVNDEELQRSRQALHDTETLLIHFVQRARKRQDIVQLADSVLQDRSHCESEIRKLEDSQMQNSMMSWAENAKFRPIFESYHGNFEELLSMLSLAFPKKSKPEIKRMISQWKEWRVQNNNLKSKAVRKIEEAKEKQNMQKFEKDVLEGKKLLLDAITLEEENEMQEKMKKDKLYAEINRECMENRDLRTKIDEDNRLEMTRRRELKKKEWSAMMDEKKKILAAHWREIASIDRAKEAFLEKEREREKKQKTIKFKFNKKRVAFRETKRKQKLEEFRMLRELEREKAELLEEQLETLRDSIRVKLHVEADPDRKFKEIKCHINKVGKLEPMVHDLFPSIGYKDDQLFRDKRFKLTHKLMQRGLHKTQAGRQAIQASSKALPHRRDCVHHQL